MVGENDRWNGEEEGMPHNSQWEIVNCRKGEHRNQSSQQNQNGTGLECPLPGRRGTQAWER